MEKGILALLLADAGVTAIVSTRIYPLVRPQGSPYPAVVVVRVSGGPEYADDGETGLEQGRLQIDCWAESYGGAKDLSAAVRNLLSALADVTSAGVFFETVLLDDERDFKEPGVNAAEYPYRVSLDFLVWIGEP